MMFVSVVGYPLAATIGAAHAGAGWFTVLFIPAGFAVGLAVTYFGRKLVYSITGLGLSIASKISKSWIQQVVIAPFSLVYFILPLAIVWGGVFGTWVGSIWLVKYLF